MEQIINTGEIGEQEFKALLSAKPASLFKQAGNLAALLPLSFASTILINGNCTTNPPCYHCRWRSASAFQPDFRRVNSLDNILAKAKTIEKAGIKRVLLLSGWMGPDLPEYFYDSVKLIREETKLEICGGFGYLSRKSLSSLKSSGLDSYFCGLEMPSESLFKKIRPGDDYQARLATMKHSKKTGLKLWSGFIFGVGETVKDLFSSLELLKKFEADVLYINPLVPSPHTEMESVNPPNLMKWSKVLAVTRLLFPDTDIITKPEYALWAFRAGANAYVHVTPQKSEVERLENLAARSRGVAKN